MILYEWAKAWGVSLEAIRDLEQRMGIDSTPATMPGGTSEAAVQANLRLAAAKRGAHLWRNNNGACVDQEGRHIRYGLANDSKKLNGVLKSSDLIGIMPIHICASDVGQTFGLFVARECKPQGWRYSGTEREQAQRRFIELINSLGGDAKFTTGEL